MRSDAVSISTPHHTPIALAPAALAAAATLAVIAGLLPLPDFTAALEDASRTLGAWAYPAVGAFAFLETGAFVGLLVPGETAVVVGGVVAAAGDVELVPLIGLVWLAAAAGDLASFVLGRRLGRPFLERHGPRLRVGPERLRQVERFYARHGGSAVLLGRFVGLVRAVSPFVAGGAGRDRATDEPQRHEGAERAEHRSDEPAGDHVEREVHAQIHARERHGGSDREHGGAKPRAQDRDGRRGGEGRGAVTGWERRIARNRGQRAESGIGHRRAGSPEGVLQDVRHERGGADRRRRRGEGHGKAAAPQIGAEPEQHEQRSLHPPRGQHDEHSSEPWMLEGRSGFDERTVEVEQWRHRRDGTQGSRTPRLILVVNGRASGIEDPERTADELLALLEELGADVESAVTHSEQQLWDVLGFAAASGWRVVLVGGDGSLHAAANAPLTRLPELALVPAGRANNIARALGIPTDRLEALTVAANASARPLDALRVATPDRFIYALEAVSAGFQAEARADYRAENSADLRQGLRALARAIRRFRPYRASVRVDGELIRSSSAAQLFFSNLPFFGFGFEVAPGADPTDGRLEAIVLEARGRTRLLRLLAAARHGRHIGRRGGMRIPG